MKKILISIVLVAIGVGLGVFMSMKQKNDFYGYHTKTDKEITQNIEKSIELTSMNIYSKTVYDFKHVKQMFLIGPYSWVASNLINPYNNHSIISHWQSSLSKEDKYLLIIANNEYFLPVILLRKYSENDFEKLRISLLTNKLCSQAKGPVSCQMDNSVELIITNINKGKSDIIMTFEKE